MAARRAGVLMILKQTVALYRRHRTSMLAASIAYYAIFSLVPLFVMAVLVVERVLAQDWIESVVLERAADVDPEGQMLLQMVVASVRDTLPGIFTAAIGIGTLLFGASHVFTHLKEALNTIWEVQPRRRSRLRNFLVTQLVALTLVPGVVIVLVALLFVDVWMVDLAAPAWVVRALQAVAVFAVLTGVLVLIYRTMPDVVIGWREVLVGAAATALLLTLGQIAIGVYLTQADLQSIYGLAAWVMFVLIWVYLSAQILLLGAEFTEAYAAASGARFAPAEGARPTRQDAPVAAARPPRRSASGSG